MAALEAGTDVALANKEALVSSGELMTAAARRSGATILPVDSEHNAIFQCLAGGRIDQVRAHHPDRQRRSVPHDGRRGHGKGHARAGRGASELVDGRQDQRRFGDDDEQGPGTDRGASSVPGRARPHRDSRSPAIGDPQPRRIYRLLDARAARLARHADPDQQCARLAAAGWRRRARRSTSPASPGSISRRPTKCGSPQRRSARTAIAEGGARPAQLNAANEIAVAAFLAGRISFTAIVDTVAPGDRCRCSPRCPHRFRTYSASMRHPARLRTEVLWTSKSTHELW